MLTAQTHTRYETRISTSTLVVAATMSVLLCVHATTYGEGSSTRNQLGSTSQSQLDGLTVDTSNAFAATDGGARIREGTQMTNRTGRFKIVGDRLTFIDQDSSLALRCLENLTLERVAHVVGAERTASELSWTVSGTVTEFQGENYILALRAIIISDS